MSEEEQKVKRVQFDFSEGQLKSLDLIKQRTGAATRAEVIRQALKLYGFFVDVPDDHIVEIIDKEGTIIHRSQARLLK